MQISAVIKKSAILFFACVTTFFSFANVHLPKLFTNNMVLQRDKPVRIWGWAGAGENITVVFNGQSLKTKAGKDSNWQVVLSPMQYGGPFRLEVSGKNSIQLDNILIGDVWLCSGQSNMDWVVKNSNNAPKEIEDAQYPSIRFFTVGKATDFKPQKDIADGEWLECNPSTVGDFSAVAYFFGRKLNRDMNIPIGLVNSSVGGTVIQAWTNWEVMKNDEKYRNADLTQIEKENSLMKEKLDKYNAALKNDIGDLEKWFEPTADTQGWKPIQLPQLWEQTDIGNTDGHIWFKKEFNLSESMEGKAITINLGPIDDEDVTYLNGKKIGATQIFNIDRIYKVDPSFLLKGKNTLVIKVTDNGGGGGLYGAPAQLSVEGGNEKVSLAGQWWYKASALSTQFGIVDYGPNSFPSQLYNAMIAPLIPFSIRGVIWYQGESNVLEGHKYQQLFPGMIADWRKQWGDDFPFLWVQIANLFPTAQTPVPSYLAELREAQHKTLSLPHTAEVIAIDLGDPNDIHPSNKQDIGRRLALSAEKLAYGKDSICGGPLYDTFTTSGNKMILTVKSMGSGLMVKDKYGYLKGFSIAGQDQQFVWAKAYLEGDKIIVYSESVSQPVAVRYAWSDNPDDANLYNKEGFPASPFRSDNWKGLTDK